MDEQMWVIEDFEGTPGKPLVEKMGEGLVVQWLVLRILIPAIWVQLPARAQSIRGG